MFSRSSTRYRPTTFREGGRARLRGVDIFSAGTHRGKTYTPADLDSMVRNFSRLSRPASGQPLLRVPAVIGHDESQEFLERSDLPAAAWPDRIYRVGRKLKADFGEHDPIPPKVVRLLKAKAYRTVSSEVYDEPPDDCPGRGKTLRRIAFLGGDIPQIKSLDEIPDIEEHSEGGFASYRPCVLKFSEIKARPSAGAWVCFSEVVPMDRDAMITELAKHGVDTSTLEQVPDPALAEMLRVCEAKDQEDQGNYDEDEDMPEPKDDAEKAQYAERAKKMSERAKRYMERYCSEDVKKMDDEPMPEPAEGTMPAQPMGEGTLMPKKVTTTHQYSESQIAAIAVAAVEKILKDRVDGAVDRLEKFRETSEGAAKTKATAEAVDALVAQGRVPPAERDAEVETLLSLDAGTLHKYTEGAKTISATAYDRHLSRLKKRPSLFGERFKHPTKGGADSEDAEVQKVEAHFEVYREQFARTGIDRDKLVAGFKGEKKRRPALTADEYLGR